MKIKKGTVLRFKHTGDHKYSYSIVVPSFNRYGKFELKYYNTKKKLVEFCGLSTQFIFNSEIIGYMNLKKLKFEMDFHKNLGSYHDYMYKQLTINGINY